ncbi:MULTISPECIES: M23 family metallopeptidase [unclassified Terrabacter]|uniref:M23 family metallopeptidase n=1 Tax=unclassified Terrabacter TaxID=2630222 RepID=UPI000A4C15A2|nr:MULTISPECIES: M23 family metallopeptidase [unclassified Terrabacter]
MRRSEKSGPATRLTAAGLVITCSVSLGSALVARADSVSDQKKRNDQKIAALGQQLEGTNAALARAYVNLQRTNAALPIAQQRVTSAQAAQARAQAAQVAAEATEARAIAAEAKARAHNEAVAQKLAVAKANEQRAKEQLAKSGADLVSSQDALDSYAAEVFQGSGQESQLGMVFGSTSPEDFANRLVMADTASAVASDTIDKLAAMTADNTSTRSYLTSVRGEIAELKRQAEAALRGAEAAAAAATQAKNQAIIAKNNAVTAAQNAAAAKTQLDQLKSKQSAYTADLAVQKQGEAADLASARAESARLQAVLVERARQARIAEQKRQARLRAERAAKIRAERAKAAAAKKRGQVYIPKTPPPVQSDPTPSNYLSYPAIGPTTSGFGMRWHPVLQKWMLHDGLDWGIACGTPVYAAAPGDIIRAGWRASGWGNQILIDHGIHRGVDLVTSYNHLSSIVKFGGSVNRGQLIGYSGTTGYSTGCHLHFGTYEDGTPVNPRKWL